MEYLTRIDLPEGISKNHDKSTTKESQDEKAIKQGAGLKDALIASAGIIFGSGITRAFMDRPAETQEPASADAPGPDAAPASEIIEIQADNPAPEINVYELSDPNVGFEEAFATAREHAGPWGIFEWQGKVYNTFYKEEWEAMSGNEKDSFRISIQDEMNRLLADNPVEQTEAPISSLAAEPEPVSPLVEATEPKPEPAIPEAAPVLEPAPLSSEPVHMQQDEPVPIPLGIDISEPIKDYEPVNEPVPENTETIQPAIIPTPLDISGVNEEDIKIIAVMEDEFGIHYLSMDSNENQQADILAVDSDADGVYDVVMLDQNEDLIIDDVPIIITDDDLKVSDILASGDISQEQISGIEFYDDGEQRDFVDDADVSEFN
jgi:hypothetical protein